MSIGVFRPAGGIQTCKQSAQITNSSSTVFSNVTGMSFSVFAGRRYFFEFATSFQTAVTTTGVGFNCTAPALTSGYWAGLIQSGASGSDMFWEQSSSSLGTLVSNAVPVQDTDYIALLRGFLTPSADGTLQLRCRSEVDTSQVIVQNVGVGYLIDAG